MRKILICGDSFAADWTVKHKNIGWPNYLADLFDVSNVAKAGVSEYKIFQQLASQNLNKFDAIIISHTSPFRLYVKKHPVHFNDVLHNQCDLIYNDIKESLPAHPELFPIVEYFEKYFDFEYATFVHKLICEKIEQTCKAVEHKVINLITFKNQYPFKNSLSLVDLFETNRGDMNHFDELGNSQAFNRILFTLNKIPEMK